MPAEEAKGEVKVKRSDLTVVAEDTNWRKYCANDLRVANEFNENWGFLTKAAQGKCLTKFKLTMSVDGQTVATTLEDRIAEVEAKMAASSGKLMNTSSKQIGRTGVRLEIFANNVNNIEKAPDLMP